MQHLQEYLRRRGLSSRTAPRHKTIRPEEDCPIRGDAQLGGPVRIVWAKIAFRCEVIACQPGTSLLCCVARGIRPLASAYQENEAAIEQVQSRDALRSTS